MKRIGPEIKMPSLKRSEFKMPPVLSDLYWDLRDRRLLPIVALLIVAIIAAPILLNKKSDSSSPAPAPVIATGATAKGGQLTVVQAEPGLRDPSKRFAHRNPTDPFKQRFNAPQVAKAEANAVTNTLPSSSSASGAEEEAVVTVNETSTGGGGEGAAASPTTPGNPSSPSSPSNPVSPSGPTERGGSSTGGGGSGESSSSPEGAPGELHYFVWTAKVQISHTEAAAEGSTEMSEPEVRESVHTLSPLPGVKMPVVTFIGVNTRTRNASFIISREVTARSGRGNCLSGGTSCELVELETGAPATFEYVPSGVLWKLKVLSTQLVPVQSPAEGRPSKLDQSRISPAVEVAPRPRR